MAAPATTMPSRLGKFCRGIDRMVEFHCVFVRVR
jgi:hypothetical protein